MNKLSIDVVAYGLYLAEFVFFVCCENSSLHCKKEMLKMTRAEF